MFIDLIRFQSTKLDCFYVNSETAIHIFALLLYVGCFFYRLGQLNSGSGFEVTRAANRILFSALTSAAAIRSSSVCSPQSRLNSQIMRVCSKNPPLGGFQIFAGS
mgnify:CR=1 FL=1